MVSVHPCTHTRHYWSSQQGAQENNRLRCLDWKQKTLPDAWDRFLLDGRHFKQKGNWGVGPFQLSIHVVQCRRTGEHWRVALGQDKQKAYIIVNSNYLWLSVPIVTFALQHGGFLPLEWLAAKEAYWVHPSRSKTPLEKLILNACFKLSCAQTKLNSGTNQSLVIVYTLASFKLALTKEQKQRRFSEIPVKPSALESLRSVFNFLSPRLPLFSFRMALVRWPEYGASWTLM